MMRFPMLEPLIELLGRPVVSELSFGPIHPDNHDAHKFHVAGSNGGATELEWINLLAALVTVQKPSVIVESGTAFGHGSVALLYGAEPGTKLVTVDSSPLSAEDDARVRAVADSRGCTFQQIIANTRDLMRPGDTRLADATGGRATFFFLDSSIPDRAAELAIFCDPRNGIMDGTKPCCACIHDMSRLRPECASDTSYLPGTAASIENFASAWGWQRLRLHASRGLYILYRHPTDPKPPAPYSAR
jgi:hypothetical protein